MNNTTRLLCTLLALCVFTPLTASAGKAFDYDAVSGRQLIDYLDHPDWHFRKDACNQVGDRKIKQAEQELVGLATGDADDGVRRECLKALKEVGSRLHLGAAESMAAGDAHIGNRVHALDVLEGSGAESSSGAVAAKVLTDDRDAGVRRKAAVIIWKRGWRNANQALKSAALNDPDAGVREEAREGLFRVGGAELRPVLHTIMLNDAEASVRREMVELFEKAPTKADRDALVGALDDTDPNVQRHAARALIKVGDRTVAPILRDKALDVPDRKVAEEFNVAAGRLGG